MVATVGTGICAGVSGVERGNDAGKEVRMKANVDGAVGVTVKANGDSAEGRMVEGEHVSDLES